MIKRWMLSFVLMLSVCTTAWASEAAHPAQTLVETSVSSLIDVLESDKAKLESDPDYLRSKIDELVVPSFDFVRMTKLAVGKHWKKADKPQKKALVHEFKELLIGTYSKAIGEYSGQTISFQPFKPGKKKNRAQVRADFELAAGTKTPVLFKLSNKKDTWRIYDIAFDGVSLVTNYRTSFSSQIAKTGIDGLIADLKKKNGAGDA